MNEIISSLPPPLANLIESRQAGDTTPLTLERVLPGEQWESARVQLRDRGVAVVNDGLNGDMFLSASFNESGQMMDVAASIPRKSGSAIDFLNQIEDFNDLQNVSIADRKARVALFHRINKGDGLTNNAINKLASLIAPRCVFKVKSVRGQRGRSNDDVKIRSEFILNWWKDNLNASSADGVITGSKGIQTWIRRGARLAFIEGDHFSRQYWQNVEVPRLGKFSLPINIQTFSSQFIEPILGLEFTDMELYYWRPPARFISQLENATDPNLNKFIKKYIPAKVRSELIKNRKYFLDPSLLMHIKHQGTDIDMFGDSIIGPSLSDIRYKRALDALEMTVITNLMARVVIIKIGSDNPDSVYHKTEVSQTRLGVLQRAMAGAGPNATILWGGPDIDVLEVSAHNALLDLVPRYQIAERRQLMSLGVPTVLMVGEGGDGKATSTAAAQVSVSRLKELQDQYHAAILTLGEQIMLENGFEEFDISLEWEANILDDPESAANLLMKMYQIGLLSAQTTIETIGIDYDSEKERLQGEVDDGIRDTLFGPPPGAVTNNPMGVDPTGTGGRPADSPNKDPRKGKETKSKTPNK